MECGMDREEVRRVLWSLSRLKHRNVPRERIEELKNMLIEQHPEIIQLMHTARGHEDDLTEHLLAYIKKKELKVSKHTLEMKETQVDPFDVSILQTQFGIDKDTAISTIIRVGGDFVDAILVLDAEAHSS